MVQKLVNVSVHYIEKYQQAQNMFQKSASILIKKYWNAENACVKKYKLLLSICY